VALGTFDRRRGRGLQILEKGGLLFFFTSKRATLGESACFLSFWEKGGEKFYILFRQEGRKTKEASVREKKTRFLHCGIKRRDRRMNFLQAEGR